MTNSQKIETAKHFILSHKNNNAEDWFLQCQHGTDKDQYLEIYSKLEGGEFGEVTTDDWGDFRIEISSHNSKTGNPIIFEWESK